MTGDLSTRGKERPGAVSSTVTGAQFSDTREEDAERGVSEIGGLMVVVEPFEFALVQRMANGDVLIALFDGVKMPHRCVALLRCHEEALRSFNEAVGSALTAESSQ